MYERVWISLEGCIWFNYAPPPKHSLPGFFFFKKIFTFLGTGAIYSAVTATVFLSASDVVFFGCNCGLILFSLAALARHTNPCLT